jgi:hypothetical protein
MGKRSRQRKRARRNQHKRLQRLLAAGKVYLNMDSQEYKLEKIDGIDVHGHFTAYRLPRGTTAKQEKALVAKWRALDVIFNPTAKSKKKAKLRFKIAQVELELVGTEL